ncbi:MAG: DUF624 domain-containing protein [Oscillospiraceae bacterium]|nr:DUF624 domain-containing protein [Oscillospiraceae bacterium]
MRGLFNADSWFWQRMNEVADLILLSLMWIVCCLPVVTIGPATVALYYVMLKKTKEEADEGIWRLFWRSFRMNWKVAGGIGLLFTALGVLLYVDVQFYAQAQGTLRPLFGALTVVGGAVYLLLMPYMVGQIAWFQNTVRRYFISGLYLVLRHFLRSIAMVAVTVLGLAAIYYFPPLIILTPALVALGHASILMKIFDRYATASDSDGEEEETPEDEA